MSQAVKVSCKGLLYGVCGSCGCEYGLVSDQGLICHECGKEWEPKPGSFGSVCDCGYWASDANEDFSAIVCLGCGKVLEPKLRYGRTDKRDGGK